MPRSDPPSRRRPPALSFAAAVVALALGLAAAPADADTAGRGGDGNGVAPVTPVTPVDDAPVGAITPGPFRGLFLDLPLADARRAAGGLDLRWTLANAWSRPTALVRGGEVALVQADAQTDSLAAAWTVPWRILGAAGRAGRITTTIEARALVHWGGYTDTPIEAWHGLAFYWNFEREKYPADATRLRLARAGGAAAADVRGPRAGLGDVVLRTQVPLLEGDRAGGPWAVALRLDVKLPTGRVALLTGSGGADAGAGLAASAGLGRFTLHGMVHLRAVSDLPRASPLQPLRLQGGLDASLVFRLGGFAFLLEDRVSTALFRGGWRLPTDEPEPEATAYYGLFRPHNQITGGIRRGPVTVFFQEDFTPGGRLRQDPGPHWFYNSNQPDIVLGVAFALRR